MNHFKMFICLLVSCAFLGTSSDLLARDTQKNEKKESEELKRDRPDKPRNGNTRRDRPRKPRNGNTRTDRPRKPRNGDVRPNRPRTPRNGDVRPNRPRTPRNGDVRPNRPRTPRNGDVKPNRPRNPRRNGHWHTRRDVFRTQFSRRWHNRTFRRVVRNYVYVVRNDYYYDDNYGYGTYPINEYMSVRASELNIRKYASADSYSKVCGSIPYGEEVFVKAYVSSHNSTADWAMVPVSDISRHIYNSDCFNGEYVYVSLKYLDYN